MQAVKEDAGNMAQVRSALVGITGVEHKSEETGPDRYVVIARMNHELNTVYSMRRRNISAYWPSFEKLVITRQRRNGTCVRQMRRIGMIPGYVFSPLDPKVDFEQFLMQIVGAIDIARTFSGNAWLIPDRDIRLIRKIEIGLNTPHPEGKVAHSFKRGHKVRFVDDLVGCWPPGVIEKLANDSRISVEVDVMGRKVPIWVLPHQIERT